MYASTGEKLTEFEVFHPDRMASRILDMGDVLTLIEQAEKAFDAGQAEEMADKLASGQDLTLEDFLTQMQQLRNAGPLKKMMGMLPGMGQMREALDNFDEREVDRIEAIIRSMTPAERRTPKIINGSRRSRIAEGSGTKPSDVNQLLERFDGAQKMMKQMAKGGGMPGHASGHGQPARHGRQEVARPHGAAGRARSRASRATRPSAPSRSAASRASPAAPQGSAFGIAPEGRAHAARRDRAARRSGPLPRRTLSPRGPAPARHGRPRRRARGRRGVGRRRPDHVRAPVVRAGRAGRRARGLGAARAGRRALPHRPGVGRPGRRRRRPRSRRSPTATRACCSSATPARRRTPGGCTTATTCRA